MAGIIRSVDEAINELSSVSIVPGDENSRSDAIFKLREIIGRLDVTTDITTGRTFDSNAITILYGGNVADVPASKIVEKIRETEPKGTIRTIDNTVAGMTLQDKWRITWHL